MIKRHAVVGAILAAVLLVGVSSVGTAGSGESKRHLVVFAGDYAVDGGYAVDDNYAVESTYAVLCNYAVLSGYAVSCNYAVARNYAVSLVTAAGGEVTNDLLGQIGVLVVDSSNTLFADVMRTYAVVQDVGEDYGWQGVPAAGDAAPAVDGGDEGSSGTPTADPLESMQWGMQMIRTREAHAVQSGSRAVDVGILDTGIDGAHADFQGANGTNVDCARGRDFVPEGPGVGNPVPCIDNGFHGTHVAGIVAAQRNGVGVAGVAPNVTLVPVKVCDTDGYCYASSVVGGVTYAGDAKLDVINMSFFTDDDEFEESTEHKCMDDPEQKAFRRAVERAMQYARNQGVTPVAALGNSDSDLSANGNCDVVPAETAGVVGTMALGNKSEKTGYSSYGSGAVDVGAPGGTNSPAAGNPTTGIFSTFPGNTYAAISGTSMASPHTTGVAALIVSQFGTLGSDGDMKLSPSSVESYLQSSAIDVGLSGYDKCFGNGRIDALRAVQKDTSSAYDASAPFCAEYSE